MLPAATAALGASHDAVRHGWSFTLEAAVELGRDEDARSPAGAARGTAPGPRAAVSARPARCAATGWSPQPRGDHGAAEVQLQRALEAFRVLAYPTGSPAPRSTSPPACWAGTAPPRRRRCWQRRPRRCGSSAPSPHWRGLVHWGACPRAPGPRTPRCERRATGPAGRAAGPPAARALSPARLGSGSRPAAGSASSGRPPSADCTFSSAPTRMPRAAPEASASAARASCSRATVKVTLPLLVVMRCPLRTWPGARDRPRPSLIPRLWQPRPSARRAAVPPRAEAQPPADAARVHQRERERDRSGAVVDDGFPGEGEVAVGASRFERDRFTGGDFQQVRQPRPQRRDGGHREALLDFGRRFVVRVAVLAGGDRAGPGREQAHGGAFGVHTDGVSEENVTGRPEEASAETL